MIDFYKLIKFSNKQSCFLLTRRDVTGGTSRTKALEIDFALPEEMLEKKKKNSGK